MADSIRKCWGGYCQEGGRDGDQEIDGRRESVMPCIGRERTGRTVDGLGRVTVENWKMPESLIDGQLHMYEYTQYSNCTEFGNDSCP